MKEVAIQRSFLDLIEEAGGYGFKMSNQFIAGIPDLYVIWPGFAPVLLEVKTLGVVTPTSHLKIPLTPLQRAKLLRINHHGTFGLVITAFELNGEKHGYVSRPEQERLELREIHYSECLVRRRKGQFNLARAFDALDVPRVNRGGD